MSTRSKKVTETSLETFAGKSSGFDLVRIDLSMVLKKRLACRIEHKNADAGGLW
jgi:hypothetical protein